MTDKPTTGDPTPPSAGYVLEYDEDERWLVMSDPEGASQIVARDVLPDDAAYLIAGYDSLATLDAEREPRPVPAGPLGDAHEWVCANCDARLTGDDRPVAPAVDDRERLAALLHVVPVASEHSPDGLTCWCGPYPDTEEPNVIIHRAEERA